MNRKSKHARLLELGKDVLIVLLACSAVWLTTRVQRTGSLGDLLADTPQEGQGQTQAPGQMEMVRPVRMAAVGRSGETTIRYGAQYDQQSTDALFQQVANLLVEALSDGGEMSPVSQWEWRTALTSPPSLYFDLMEGVPLSVLTGWLTGESTGGEVFVRRLALAASRGQVFLYYQDEESGQFYAGPVDVISVSRLESAVSGLSDNGACFAFEKEGYSLLSPYTLLMPGTPQPAVYQVYNPLSREEGLNSLLEALDFPASSSYTYQGTDGELVVRNGYDTLRVSAQGTVRYHTTEGEISRYPVASDTGGTGCYEAVEACRVLVSETLGTQCGAARLVLTHVERITGGWAVEFGYCLDGAAVQVYEEGCAARFLVQNGQIAEITLQARSYEETAESGLVLPRLQAMAAMEAAGLEGRELLLGYQDSGGGTVTAGWIARREIRDWQLQDKALEQAVSFLAERGIQVDERIVPRSAELPPMGMERDLEEEQTLAAALLGDGLTREERSGEVYVYEGERGLLQCHSSGEFWADFQSGAFPVPEGAEMAEHALETMELLHFQGEVVSSAGNAQDGSVTLRQLWNGVPVLPCRATLVYEGGELKRIEEGRRLTGTPQTTAGTPITATTALMRFYAGLSERMDICSEVREIEIAYTLSNALGGPISLIPVWHITTDTEIYELNTLDGSLAAAGAEETERTEQ